MAGQRKTTGPPRIPNRLRRELDALGAPVVIRATAVAIIAACVVFNAHAATLGHYANSREVLGDTIATQLAEQSFRLALERSPVGRMCDGLDGREYKGCLLQPYCGGDVLANVCMPGSDLPPDAGLA
jgi:hypothetical protein